MGMLNAEGLRNVLVHFLFAAACVMVLLGCGQAGQGLSEEPQANTVIGKKDNPVPPVDRSRPEKLERATFALG